MHKKNILYLRDLTLLILSRIVHPYDQKNFMAVNRLHHVALGLRQKNGDSRQSS